MKPLMYGYLRVCPDMDNRSVTDAGRQLATLAHDEGFELGQVFLERGTSSSNTWTALASHCLEDGVRDVVVLEVAELFHEPHPVPILRELIQEIIGGRVWSANEATGARKTAGRRPVTS
ncbi:hypothetical protein [Embleya sp. NPDC020630]|uniref:hypothetical protein n=1 Tax=Embleya sp. NPDC020630 TaxID=3363979 RepID=UPI003789CB10